MTILQEKTMNNGKRSSLEIFGGEEAISKRMREKIRQVTQDQPNYIAKLVMQIDPAVVVKVISDDITNEPDINETYSVFRRLEHAFDLSFANILGQPVYENKDIEEYWMSQYKHKPMVMAARLPDGSRVEYADAENKKQMFYFNLRVRGELERRLINIKEEIRKDVVRT